MFAPDAHAHKVVPEQHYQGTHAQAQPAAQQNTTCHATSYQRRAQHESRGVFQLRLLGPLLQVVGFSGHRCCRSIGCRQRPGRA